MFALPLWVIAIAGAALIAAAVEFGRLLGRRAAARGEVEAVTIEAASLGLLALILGFTFAISIERHDGRRGAIIAEANAIGTAALRATLLEPQYGAPILDILARYADLRRKISSAVADDEALAALIAKSDAEIDALWALTREAVKRDKSEVPTGYFVEALNALIDEQERRVAAARARVPEAVLAAVYFAAFVALGFSGYAAGADKRRARAPTHVLGALIGLIIVIIQDLDRPGRGLVNVDQTPLTDAAAQVDGAARAISN